MKDIKIPSTGSKYTEEQKREALAHYVVIGNVVKVSELVNIPRPTVQGWVRSEWGNAMIISLKQEKQEEIDANLTRILHKATEALEDRIDHGDTVINKDGETLLKPVSGRDLATISGIMFDKRQILRNMPTSIRAESTDQRLNALADKVRELQGGTVTIEHTPDTP